MFKFRGKEIDSPNEIVIGDLVYKNSFYYLHCYDETNRTYQYKIVYKDSLAISIMEKDKNGKEIFGSFMINDVMTSGGDKVLTDEAGWKGNVVYLSGMFMCTDSKGGYSSYCNWNSFEVIGNQYEGK